MSYGSRDPGGRSGELLHDNAQALNYIEAARDAEVVFVATPWADNVTLDILASLEPTADPNLHRLHEPARARLHVQSDRAHDFCRGADRRSGSPR